MSRVLLPSPQDSCFINRACRWGISFDEVIRRYGYRQVVRATVLVCRRGEFIAWYRRDLEVGALGTRNIVAALGIAISRGRVSAVLFLARSLSRIRFPLNGFSSVFSYNPYAAPQCIRALSEHSRNDETSDFNAKFVTRKFLIDHRSPLQF